MKNIIIVFALLFIGWNLSAQKWKGSTTINGNLYRKGNVGIGITSPTRKLHVKGGIYSDGGWFRVSGKNGLYFQDYGGGFRMTDNQWIRTYGNKNFYHNSGIMRTDGQFQVGGNGSRFLVASNGRVGIGNGSPSYKLHVRGDIYSNDGWFRVAGKNGLYFQDYGGGFHMTDKEWIRTYGNKNFYHNAGVMRTDGQFQVGGNGSRFLVASNGKVGIGITSPTRKLHVKGGIYSDGGWFRVSGKNGLYFQDYGGGFHMTDNKWIRTYGNKNFYHNSGIMRTDGQFQVGGNGSKFLVASNGKVGIGNSSPSYKLHVRGDIYSNDGWFRVSGKNGLYFQDYGGGFHMTDNKWIRTYGNKNFYHNSGIMRTDGQFQVGGNGSKFLVASNGNVGIGTTNPGAYKLAVNGKVRAKEVVVETGWSDFVFEKDYKLPTLKEVEQHIKKHGHLKDIPSAKEVAEKGVKLGQMDSKLLQKIEELTLYIIDQNKQIKVLKDQNRDLIKITNELQELKKQIKKNQ